MTTDQPQPDKPPGKPRGKALRLTDEQLDAMAQVTPADVPFARNLWQELAPKWAEHLPDAVER